MNIGSEVDIECQGNVINPLRKNTIDSLDNGCQTKSSTARAVVEVGKLSYRHCLAPGKQLSEDVIALPGIEYALDVKLYFSGECMYFP